MRVSRWAFPLKTMFMGEVACEICQWTAVADAVPGLSRRLMTKLQTLRKKLFWLTYHCARPLPGMHGYTGNKK